eukprot:TRINITY_DN1448_c0_g1_i1.p1 TRINITY_DN1448_c0_g1~~TRINITY_DN1448_c0_g1_i1.p1  ORF type:complete len:355 (+),score=123.55 TRINITY_DN1448_c0_g1_i1:80-1066(+)
MLAAVLGLSSVCAQAAKYGYPSVNIGKDVHGNPVDLPMVGIGTWLYNDTKVYETVKTAFTLPKTPYRHVDCAYNYGNQAGVGRALKDAAVERGSYFVTSKVEGGLTPERTLEEAADDLSQLGLDYIDLLLVHYPCSLPGNNGSREMRQAQWKAMEQLYNQGKARAIGVSHFCERHMQDIYDIATVKPAVNQVQFHVGMGQAPVNATDLTRQYCNEHGLLYQSFSPLCGPCCLGKPANCTANHDLYTGPVVTSIAKKYNVTGAQVSLRWQVQQGIPVIPKSHSASHQAENIDLFDWKLDDEDMATLTAQTYPPVAAGPSDVDSGDCALP